MLEQLAGARVAAPTPSAFNGIPAPLYPRVALSPEWAPVLEAVAAKAARGAVALGPDAALVLDGADITIHGPLDVSLCCRLAAAAGAAAVAAAVA